MFKPSQQNGLKKNNGLQETTNWKPVNLWKGIQGKAPLAAPITCWGRQGTGVVKLLDLIKPHDIRKNTQ